MESCEMNRKWSANWIGTGLLHSNWKTPARPAPYFRRSFRFDGKKAKATVFICGLGYYELYLNGKKVGDHVLDPVVSQYERHARYVVYDVSGLLKRGENVFGAVLGTGWYDCHTTEVWHFDKAPWRDNPKMIFELEINGKTVFGSDDSWRCLKEDGPIRFDGLRNGEFYDAQREMPGWAEKGFDDSNWKPAEIVPGPGGELVRQIMPPCKVMARISPVEVYKSFDGAKIYDIGQNITGWARIKVKGAAGAEIKLRYAEKISSYKDQILQDNISSYIKSGETQTDRYTLKGGAAEEWEPRFTYHGFRYVEVSVTGEAEILGLEGCLVHTSFRSLTEFKSSDATLNKLFECTRWSFIDNFTGIPTDCPHREKNGWTGDALMAAETGLFMFDMASSYHDWEQTIADAQRPNGQLPGIVPTSGWGYNWGSGPAWDSAFILIPWYVYLYSGETRILEENYEKMKRYIGFLGTLAKARIVKFGLGDWCHVDISRIADVRVTSTGYYYADTVVMMKCAELLGQKDDAKAFRTLASEIKDAFNKEFYRGNGIYAKGEMTALACALYQGLCPEKECAKTAAKLNETVLANGCRTDFGILGAKYVPRALANYGYAETAYRMITQPAFPGWVNWINHGATTLWEAWDGGSSLNHIMFGDIAAWMMQYLAGIVPDEKHPGFSELTIRPFVPEGLDSLKVSYSVPGGKVKVDWKKKNGRFRLDLTVPKGIPCRVFLPDGSSRGQKTVFASYECARKVQCVS